MNSCNGKIPSQAQSCLVKKDGQCNIVSSNMEEKRQRYIADIFTTCLDIHWRYLLLLFSSSFIVSWLFFGIIFYSVSLYHGDFDEHSLKGAGLIAEGLHGFSTEHTPAEGTGGQTQRLPCILHVQGFLGALLFSMETQTTIGYRRRCITAQLRW